MENTPPPGKRIAILLVVFCSLSILGLLGRATYQVVAAVTEINLTAAPTLAGRVLDVSSMLFCAALLLPVLVQSVRRLRGQEIRQGALPAIKPWQAVVLAGVWLPAIVLAGVLSGLLEYGWALAAPLFLLGVALPVAGLAWVAAGGLPSSRRRLWGVFGVSMTGSTLLAILVEYLVFGAAALVVGIVLLANPEWQAVLENLKDQVTAAGDIQAILIITAPYLTNPLVFTAVLVFAAVIGPLIEEALKPLAVWVLGRRLRSPAEGFALGALCGAGFALLEGLLAASGSPEMLGFGLAGRAAGSLMHITASGLVGWGIASAFLERRYARLAGAYLLASAMHGLWNGSALLAVYGALRFAVHGMAPEPVGMIAAIAGLSLLGLTFTAMLVALPLMNLHLRSMQPASPESP